MDGESHTGKVPCRVRLIGVFAVTAASVGVFLTVLWHSEWLGMLYMLNDVRHVLVWPDAHASLITIVASFCTGVLGLWANYQVKRMVGESRALAWARTLVPLALLPWVCFVVFMRRYVSQTLTGNILFYGPVVLLSVALLRRVGTSRTTRGVRPGVRMVWIWSIVCAIAYTCIGWYFTQSVGEHSGDEAHYLIQAHSLYHDRDLDLHNNLADEYDASVVFEDEARWRFRISHTSAPGKWYSRHSFGISVLLAPFVPLGLFGRHLALGIVAGLGTAAMVLLCRCFGATGRATRAVLGVFLFSTFWGVYACRALPETLGATLTAWFGVAVFWQRRRPRLSTCIALFAAAALPWVHERFVPISLYGSGVYALCAGIRTQGWRARIVRVGVFGGLSLLFLLGYVVVHSRMFTGGTSYPVRELLFSFPLGVWLVHATPAGILYILPLFGWILAGVLWVIFRDQRNRWPAIFAFTALLAVYSSSCATEWWSGGAGGCVAGRFLLVVMPLLLAPAARCFDLQGRLSRWWLLFLGAIPMVRFWVMLANLDMYGLAFSDPPGSLPVLFPLLEAAYVPFLRAGPHPWYPAAIIFLAGTTALLFLPRRQVCQQALLLGVMLVACVGFDHAASTVVYPRYAGTEKAVRMRDPVVQEWGDGSPECEAAELLARRADDADGRVPIEGIDLAGQSFSLAFRVRRASPASGIRAVLCQGIQESNHGLLVAFDASSSLVFSFVHNDLAVTTERSQPNEWESWAMTYEADGNLKRIYHDGALVAVDLCVEDYLGTGTLYVGTAPWGGIGDLEGDLADLRIYRRCLTPDEIEAMDAQDG